MTLSFVNFSQFISELNEQAQTQSASATADWAVKDLADRLCFDSAWFGWADLSQDIPRIQTQTTLSLPIGFYQYWQQMSHQDVLIEQVLRDGLSIATYEREGSRQSDGMVSLADKFHLNKIVTVIPEHFEVDRMFFLSTYRNGANQHRWDSREAEFLQCAADQLGKVVRSCAVKRSAKPGLTQIEVVVSDQGMLLFGLHLLKSELGDLFTDWQGPYLPKALLATIQQQGRHVVRDYNLIVNCNHAYLEGQLPLVNLQIRKMTALDLLSKREFAVAKALATGMSHKEVAKMSNVSPSTVRNQTQAIYIKLGVDNRASLASLIANS
jgi:DNA-binding CsgD family transcriptional regulator